jgi:uncharacterized membrane protein
MQTHAENAIDTSVTIRCPVDQVFTFYRDFENLPRFLGDVMAIEQINPTTSLWTIQGPLARHPNELEDKSD